MKDIPFEKVSPEEARAATSLELDTPDVPEADRTINRLAQEQSQTRPDVKELLPWLKQLPPEVRPKELIVQYARIANRIAHLWKHPLVCEKYLNELMLDERGTRKGFPPEVALELVALHGYFNTHVLVHQYDVWGDRIGGE